MDKSNSRKAILNFIFPIVVGTLAAEAITSAVFVLIGKFTLSVIWGALWGTAAMTVYYLLMARTIIKAADMEPSDAKKRVQASYSMRMLLLLVMMGSGLYISVTYGVINWIPLLLAAFYPTVAIKIWQLITNTKNMLSGEAEKDGE